MDRLNKQIDVAMGRKKADLVLKNASIINVFTQSIDNGDIAINGDVIVGIGKYQGIKEIDCTNKYITPGFIDGHVHIESAMVTPEIFSQLIINKGITTIIADPHEIANIMGLKGIKLMIDNSKKSMVDIKYMLPSCVPAVSFEDNGATLNARKLKKLLGHKQVKGLGEVMDVNAVTNKNQDMLTKIWNTKKIGKNIDGHCPNISNKELNAYLCVGINTDHECTNKEEALEKVKQGMYVLMREGSQARDLRQIIKGVNDKNYHRFLFCTDDRHVEDLIEEGSIDYCIKLAIKEGLDPIKAYTIASFNAANCYNMFDRGAIAPGRKADLVILSDLTEVKIDQVLKNGNIIKENRKYQSIKVKKSMNIKPITKEIFQIKPIGKEVNVIKVLPKSLYTKKLLLDINEIDNIHINKIAVLERHKKTGKSFTGYIEGLSLNDCAIAQSIAHDSHNIVVVGSNDDDMTVAVNQLIKIGGGIVFVANGKVLEALSLPIGGIMTCSDPLVLYEKMKKLNKLAREHGIKEGIDPFITLSFMALPVIPEIKITPRGLFDYQEFKFINLFK